MARPITKANELGAAPHIVEPISNIVTEHKKTVLTENTVYNLPKRN
jgi:hypothetical protein